MQIELLESLLQEKHIKKYTLAEALGVKPQNINKMLRAKKINVTTIQKIAELLGVDMSVLIGEKVEQPQQSPEISGFVKVNGIVHEINSIEDFQSIMKNIIKQ